MNYILVILLIGYGIYLFKRKDPQVKDLDKSIIGLKNKVAERNKKLSDDKIKQFWKSFIFVLLFSNISKADVRPIEYGSPAPYKGYIMTVETELKIRTELDYDREMIKDLNEKIALEESVKESDWDKALWFGLGIITVITIHWVF